MGYLQCFPHTIACSLRRQKGKAKKQLEIHKRKKVIRNISTLYYRRNIPESISPAQMMDL